MMRICALNEDTSSSTNDEHEPEVTREAQETIACSEYMRALNLKRQGHTEAALGLFEELVQTQVLQDVSSDKTKKLFSVKYNCLRNASFILEEKGEKRKALFYAKQAILMDDTDIYTLSKAGHLALLFDESEVAMVLFQRCQEFNPNHWPSADGILKALCLQGNFMAAYGWAMHWHKRDQTYELAIKVLVELHEKFKCNIPMFEDVFKTRFNYERFKHMRSEESCFASITIPAAPQVKYKDLSRFRVSELTWLSVGEWIINVYDECYGSPENLIRMHTWSDLLIKDETPAAADSENLPSVEEEQVNGATTENDEKNLPQSVPEKTEPMDTGSEAAAETTIKSCSDESSDVKTDSDREKPKKRRGSDLSFLEQWGWHKNRRHTRKRAAAVAAAEPPVEQEDVTIGTFLKRVFAKYYNIQFDTKESPFEAETPAEETHTKPSRENRSQQANENSCFKAPPTEQETDFQKLTHIEFEAFLQEFEYFDLIPLLYKWLTYTSSFWRLNFPPQIAEQYVKIYIFYLTHYGFQQWSSMDCDEFKQVYGMGLFYVEQMQELVQTKRIAKSEMAEEFHRLRTQLMAHFGFYYLSTAEEFLVRSCRYRWNSYLVARLENDFEQCLESLEWIEMSLAEQEERDPVTIRLPNKKEDGLIELELVRALIRTLKRTISLNNVGRLYAEGKYRELIPILKDSLINCTTIKSADNSVMKLQTQFEILLECLWNVEDEEGCLLWTERCFKYCIDLYETIPEFSYRLKEWGAAINFILTYLEALVNKHGVEILVWLGRNQCRLVQNLIRLVVHQLDSPVDKNNPEVHAVNLKIPWILLYLVRYRDEVSNCPLTGVESDGGNENSRSEEEESTAAAAAEEKAAEEEDHIPMSFLLLFTAHDHLGRKLWCTKDGGELLKFIVRNVGPLVRTPLLEPFRDMINEYLEQVTYCLFAYPPKKARSRHIEEHDANQLELTWENAIDLFDLYRPDTVPEFDAYKVDSISVDMEQLLQKILPLIPAHLDLSAGTAAVKEFISGKVDKLAEINAPQFPHRIAAIYYLIADYHFKNRDFTKPTKFYVLDLAMHPWRFDSWAGLALSKATKAETKINLCNSFNAQEFLAKSEDAIRCFETCLKLRDKHTMLWIEYGSFTYMLHSYCSRSLKQVSDTLSMDAFAVLETYKEKFLKIAYSCFHRVDLYLLEAVTATPAAENDDESHDEKWLYHYMLGKVAEKKKDPPKVYLEHYLKSSKFLYECNATYPYKINHSNPQNLSIEALEIFYRITSSILKYLEQHEVVKRDVGKLFERMLRELMNSPFTFNKAKLDNNSINALKRKMATQEEQQKKASQVVVVGGGLGAERDASEKKTEESGPEVDIEEKIEPVVVEKKLKLDGTTVVTVEGAAVAQTVASPSRRTSQESIATSVTTTTTSRTTTTSSTSSSSESSDSSTDDDEEEDATASLTEREIDLIYKICVKNLEECLTRFPEHYKSANRLVHHYLYAPQKLRNMTKARELLLSTYITASGNKIQGLFADSKANNFFNGIWRIPSSEIDRPGSFAAHLSKAVILLLEVLKASSEYEITFDLAVHLHRSPDPDKKYIKDSECKELLQQALSCCCQSFRNILKRHAVEKRNDDELVNLLLEVNKMYRKCIKQIPGKEGIFTPILVEVYKAYVEDKVRKLPEHLNAQDLATKFCNHEINRRKNAEKGLPIGPVSLPGIPMALLVSSGIPQSAAGIDATMGIPNLPRSTTISVAPGGGGGLNMEGVINPAGATQKVAIAGKSVSAGSGGGGVSGSGAGAAVKPRGRPSGSKNIGGGMEPGNAAAIMKQMMGNMDQKTLANMSALMSLYSTPQVQNDPDAINKVIAEYYKMLLGSAPIAMAQQQQQMKANVAGGSASAKSSSSQQGSIGGGSKQTNVPSSSLSGPSVPSSSRPKSSLSLTAPNKSGASEKSMPKYDMKSLIQSVVTSNILNDPKGGGGSGQNKPGQSSISLGGGQLTITPTQVQPQQLTKGKSGGGGEPHNLAKKQQPQPPPYLPDLPKSLTITASNAGGGSSGGSTVTLNKGRGSGGGGGNNKMTQAKPSVTVSKVPPQQTNTMNKEALAKQIAANQMLMQMMPGGGGASSQEYEMYMKTMAAYSDLVRGRMTAGQQKQPQQQQQQGKKKAQGGLQQQLHHQGAMNVKPSTVTSKKAPNAPYPISTMPHFPNMAFQDQPSSSSAKLNQMQMLARMSTEPPGGSSVNASPPKTLQQKLAERQKANSLLESKSQMSVLAASNNKRKSANEPDMGGGSGTSGQKKKKAPKVDVIVLD